MPGDVLDSILGPDKCVNFHARILPTESALRMGDPLQGRFSATSSPVVQHGRAFWLEST